MVQTILNQKSQQSHTMKQHTLQDNFIRHNMIKCGKRQATTPT